MRGTCSPGFKLTSSGPEEQVLPGLVRRRVGADDGAPTRTSSGRRVWLGIASDAVARARAFVRAEARKTPGTVPPTAHAPRRGCRRSCSRCATACTAQAAEFDAIMTRPTGMDELLTVGWALKMNNIKVVVVGDGAADRPRGAADHRHRAATRTTRSSSVGRHYRDALSAALMISNDRIFAKNASMLLVLQGRMTSWTRTTRTTSKASTDGLVEHGLIIPVRVPGAFGRGAGVRGRARALQRPGRRVSRRTTAPRSTRSRPSSIAPSSRRRTTSTRSPTSPARSSASSARTSEAQGAVGQGARRRAVGRHAGDDRRLPQPRGVLPGLPGHHRARCRRAAA